jgi:Uma2 family endonuclease
MNILATPTRYTPDDLLRMPDSVNYELVDGQLVERNMGMKSGAVEMILGRRLGNHCEPNQLGHLFGSTAGYQCFPDAPNKVRKPDVSFVSFARMPLTPESHSRIAPDMATEVVSPNDLCYEVEAKIDEYLSAGVKLVWVVNPDRHTVHVYRLDGTVTRLKDKDELSGEHVIPGFRCLVHELFPSLPAAPPSS